MDVILKHTTVYCCVCMQAKVISHYRPDAPRGLVLNPTGIALPPVMRQYVEALVDKQWSSWRRKGCVGCHCEGVSSVGVLNVTVCVTVWV